MVDPPPCLVCLSTWGGQILKIPLVRLVLKFVSLSVSCVTSNLKKISSFSQIPDLVHWRTAAAVARQNCH